MVDDGYLVGYEDGSGNFVEVGRFNNTSENVSDPLIIQHSDSGEKIELGPNGFSTESISTGVVANNDTNVTLMNPDIGASGESFNISDAVGAPPIGFLTVSKSSFNNSTGLFILDGIGGIEEVADFENEFGTSQGSGDVSVFYDGSDYIIELNEDATIPAVIFLGRGTS